MARPKGTAAKPNEGFEDMPILMRAIDEDAYKKALDKAVKGDITELEGRGAFTPMEVHERASVESFRNLDLAIHRKSVGVVADVALSHAGESLREARLRAGYTQAEAAEAIGVTDTTITRIERGTSKPSLETLVMLCWLYNVSVDRVLGIMTPTEEHLLEVYRSTVEEAKPAIIAGAERYQTGYGSIGDKLDEFVDEFRAGLRERAENPPYCFPEE